MKTILVIEDDQDDQYLLEHKIGGRFALTFADNLKDGLALLKILSPDAVLLDLELPDSRREETLAQVKRGRTHSAIVVISGHTRREFVEQTIAETADGFIRKGLDDLNAEAVVNQINAAVKSRQIVWQAEEQARRLEQ